MSDSERGTGRTTAILRQALDAALSNQHVVFVVHRVEMISYCIGLLRHLSADVQQQTRIKILVPNGGSITFFPQWSERLAINKDGSWVAIGMDSRVFIDHFVDRYH